MVTKKEWTVMFLVQIRELTDQEYFEPILASFMSLELTDNVEVIFCVNFKIEYRPRYLGLQYDLDQTRAEEGFTTGLFKLQSTTSGQNELKFIDEIPGFDITAPGHIGTSFISRIKKEYVAKRYMLFTWDHGNGYSIFKRQQGETFSRLTMRKLNEAIQIGLGADASLDLLVMMNCWMQLIDTLYAVQGNINYLVAPQDNVKLDVYDMKSVLQKLVQSPNMSAKDLSIQIVESIKLKEQNKRKTVAIAAINVMQITTNSYFNVLVELTNGIRNELNIISSTSTVKTEVLKNIRDQFLLTHVLDTGEGFIDLHSLMNNLCQVVNATNKKLTFRLINILNNSIMKFYTNHPNKRKNEWDEPHGFNIKSPFAIPVDEKIKEKGIDDVVKDVKDTDFNQTTWGTLMQDLSEFDFQILSGQIQIPTQ